MNTKEIEKKIKDWCTDEGIFKIKRPNDSKADFIFDLTYPFNHPRPMHFLALVPKERDFLRIICGTKISPPHLQCLKKVEVCQKFLQQFTKTVLFLQVIHSIKHEKNVPVFWELSDQIYFDGLSKNEFFKSIRKIYFATISAILILNELCGAGEIPKSATDMDYIPFYG
ncbi:MAG: DUF2299 family protein [Promethearchaeota archaeon]